MNQWVGLALSYVFIFAVIGAAQGLLAAHVVGPSGTRKIVHIGVAHWWILAMLTMESMVVALIGPVSFVLINWWSWRTHFFRAMEHEDHRRNLGTIWFPVSLVLLVLLTWSGLFPRWYGLVAILILGWGDGMASVVGERWGQRDGAVRFTVPGGRKSVAGTITMFCAAGLVTVIVTTLAIRDGVPAGPGFVGSAGALVEGIRSAVARSWLGRPTENTTLMALAQLDAVLRVAVERTAGETGLFPVMAPTTLLATALVVAAAATAVELITPWGLDNISVPVTVFIVLAGLLALPQEWVVRLAWALGLNILVAITAYLRRTVTATGALAGAATGLVIFLAGGGFFWSLLMAFFFSSSVLSRLKKERKRAAEALHQKGSRRDAVQVLANGGLAAVMAGAWAITASPFFLLGFAIALAAANADTWASEIGVLSSRPPVSILTMRPVTRGTSGGVSPLGLAASAGGALFIALWFAAGSWLTLGWSGLELLAVVAAITGGGFLGSLVDSALGATVQAQYHDTASGSMTERRWNAAGQMNRLTRGWAAMNNDAVNALSGIISTVILMAVLAA